ncbi:hypothetical protein [Labrys wisconsinensis]|uniref:Uncharacterized protein n=1 Tax=Labrys wisconsinensis TaxID=425677 RepID=A0ABU0JII4_9HYPH|nr:hypothetical protein [Labrys wisconsinensis]MDQ0473084.1 hypothetical protein [Labrys wisconsinensis]
MVAALVFLRLAPSGPTPTFPTLAREINAAGTSGREFFHTLRKIFQS